MTMKNFLFVGDSHLMAVLHAAKGLPGAVCSESGVGATDALFRTADIRLPERQIHMAFISPLANAPYLLVQRADGIVTMAAEYMAVFNTSLSSFGSAPYQLCSYFFGNEHSNFAMVEHPTPFDVFDGTQDGGVAQGAKPRQVIAPDVMSRQMLSLCVRTEVYCQTLQAYFPEQTLIHFLPPPPIADASQVQGNPEVFQEHFRHFGLAPAVLRRKIYRMFCAALTGQLSQRAIRVIGTPPTASDDGYLAERYWEGSTHANYHYGHLLLAELEIA